MTSGGLEEFDRLMADAGDLGISEHEILSCFFANRPVSYWRFDGTNYFVAGNLKDPDAAPVTDDAGRPALLSQPKDEVRQSLRAAIAASHAAKSGVNLRRSLRLDGHLPVDFQVLAFFEAVGETGSLMGVSYENFAPFKMVAVSKKAGGGTVA